MTHVAPPACYLRGCTRFYGCMGPPNDPTYGCEAYPLGIPDDIVLGEDLHLTSRGDDDGLVYLPEVVLKHQAGRHDQQTHTPKKYAGGRVWDGEQVDVRPTVSKLQTGAIGEDMAMRALSDMMGAEFQSVNVGLNNAPIDVVGDHTAVEVKTGLASNGRSAQHWRATIGQPGIAESEAIAHMTPDEKRTHHARKRRAIMDRKAMMLTDMSREVGAPIRGMTVGVILAPDGSRGDVFAVPGFHQRLAWKDYATDRYYLGTYEAGEVD